jgi:signal transduction histidine kinase
MVEQNASFPATEQEPHPRPVPLIPLILGLLIIAVIGVAAYLTQSNTDNSRDWVIHTYDVRSELQDLETHLSEIRGSALAYSGSGDQSQLQSFHQNAQVISGLTDRLRRLTADNPRQQTRLDDLESSSRKYVTQLETTSAAGAQQASNSPGAASLRALDSQRSQVDAIVHSMDEEEKTLLDLRLANWNRLFRRNALVLGLAFAAALVFLAYNFRLLTREVVRTHELERLQRESAQSSRALSARILDLQDGERRRVARELHDSVGQYLVGLKINLEQLRANGANLAPAHERLLAETVELAERSIVEVRTISHLLHPPLLDEVGLESAARWYADGFAKRCGLKVNLELSEITNRLPKEVELALFRVLQESLTNVHRHANAKSIEIILTCGAGRVALAIHDDGDGIPHEVLSRFRSRRSSGVGLAGMRERLSDLDGILEVEKRSRGTTIRAIIPVVECAPPERRALETAV